eukprot:TRINITY_DN3786_c0_g1_i10.p3 TRINITY_DN3786_c0_g1~~TRINITY_DN3786_c0_g1_i10.p3  ORF type:complete len:170 (-),score=16.71 TRINITY_DN3786_c0_g1_i10:525-1034(-)
MVDAQLLQDMFRQLDMNSNGFIDVYELQRALKVNGLDFSLQVVAQMIRMFDRDQNGRISFTEFEKVYDFLHTCEQAFRQSDTNGDGQLTRGEVAIVLAAGNFNLEGQILETVINIFDPDTTNSITFDEYIRMICFLRCARDGFFYADRNRTGKIELDFNQFVTYASNCK